MLKGTSSVLEPKYWHCYELQNSTCKGKLQGGLPSPNASQSRRCICTHVSSQDIYIHIYGLHRQDSHTHTDMQNQSGLIEGSRVLHEGREKVKGRPKAYNHEPKASGFRMQGRDVMSWLLRSSTVLCLGLGRLTGAVAAAAALRCWCDCGWLAWAMRTCFGILGEQCAAQLPCTLRCKTTLYCTSHTMSPHNHSRTQTYHHISHIHIYIYIYVLLSMCTKIYFQTNIEITL